MPGYQSHSWCFTLYEEPSCKVEDFRYIVMGKEKCPTTGRIHWQGYAETHKKTAMAGMKKLLNDKTAHLEPRKGTAEEASKYCKKDDDFIEHGTMVKMGERTDLKKVAEELVSRKRTLDDVMESEPELYCRYRNGLKDLESLALKKEAKTWRNVDVTVLWGEAGSGKTRKAVEEDDYYLVTVTKNQWWDGYNGQKTIIIDDYYGDWSWNFLLRVLDGYICQLPIKGGFTYALWTKVIITSNVPPPYWYPNQRDYAPLMRRIKKVAEVKVAEVPQGNTEPVA